MTLATSRTKPGTERVPPGQRVTDGWPVLTYGSAPKLHTEDWKFAVAGVVKNNVSLTWDEFTTLPQQSYHNDIHCVTGWSKLDNDWVGVPFKEVAAGQAGPGGAARDGALVRWVHNERAAGRPHAR